MPVRRIIEMRREELNLNSLQTFSRHCDDWEEANSNQDDQALERGGKGFGLLKNEERKKKRKQACTLQGRLLSFEAMGKNPQGRVGERENYLNVRLCK